MKSVLLNKQCLCITIYPMEKEQKNKGNKFHLFKWHLHNQDNDIKFRGPLSYRHLRIIAWIFMMFMAMSVVFSSFVRFRHAGEAIQTTADIFSTIGSLALPTFLIANFGLILRNHKEAKKTLVMHGLIALGMMALAYLFVFRYVFTVLSRYNGEVFEVSQELVTLVLNWNPSKFVYLNIFIDLFLCSLSFFLLTYEPKKFFTGKKIILFRLLVILPIAYEVACVYVKLHTLTTPEFNIPWYVFPLLTTKPPLLLLSFFILTIIFAIRKHLYLKRGHTEDEFDAYLKTNANSLQFSITTCVVLLFAIALDIVVLTICSNSLADKMIITVEEASDEVLKSGIGKCLPVVFIFPLIILFSYSKTHKDTFVDKVIPLAGITICVYSVVESLVQLYATIN